LVFVRQLFSRIVIAPREEGRARASITHAFAPEAPDGELPGFDESVTTKHHARISHLKDRKACQLEKRQRRQFMKAFQHTKKGSNIAWLRYPSRD
jgi:hypothetical protein